MELRDFVKEPGHFNCWATFLSLTYVYLYLGLSPRSCFQLPLLQTLGSPCHTCRRPGMSAQLPSCLACCYGHVGNETVHRSSICLTLCLYVCLPLCITNNECVVKYYISRYSSLLRHPHLWCCVVTQICC